MLKKLVQWFVGFWMVLISGSVIILWPMYKQIETETITLIDQANQLTGPQKGWSFPGKMYSAAAPLSLPSKQLVSQAKARDYILKCPPSTPGEYCTDGTVIPRGGVFPEGTQPPGLNGWSRNLALEPVELGPLLGPDSEIRTHLPLGEAPHHLVSALLISEDKMFYEHWGVNFLAFVRAAFVNIKGGRYSQGASTITMQLVRNLNQQKHKTLDRKLREILAAIAADHYLGKDAVLQMYLDSPYLGQDGSYSICGFAAASRFYFNKDIREVTLDEAALLVGILPAPGRFRPDKNPDLAQEKRDRVLRLMQGYGWEVDDAIKQPVTIQTFSQNPSFQFHSYTQATLQWLEEKVDKGILYGAGVHVFTALDVVQQERTQKVFDSGIKLFTKTIGLPKKPPLQAAGALINPDTGYLEAAYAGTIESPYDFSRATQAKRQAGSSFKPLVYALAFSHQDVDGQPLWKSFDTVPNLRRTFPNTDGWRPRNNGSIYSTVTTLANAMARSQNVATATLLEQLGGPLELITFAAKLGFETKDYPNEMGLALGQAEVTPLEMARFSAMMANGGIEVTGSPVVLAKNKNGAVLIDEPALGARVLTPQAAALTRSLMGLVLSHGTGGASRRGAAGIQGYLGTGFGKTGTTDQNKDLWLVGGTPHYGSALWLGYDQPTNLRASSSDLAAPLWGWWMRSIHGDRDAQKTYPDQRLKSKYLCRHTGMIGNGSCKLLPIPVLEGQRSRKRCPTTHVYLETEVSYQNVWSR